MLECNNVQLRDLSVQTGHWHKSSHQAHCTLLAAQPSANPYRTRAVASCSDRGPLDLVFSEILVPFFDPTPQVMCRPCGAKV